MKLWPYSKSMPYTHLKFLNYIHMIAKMHAVLYSNKYISVPGHET